MQTTLTFSRYELCGGSWWLVEFRRLEGCRKKLKHAWRDSEERLKVVLICKGVESLGRNQMAVRNLEGKI